MTTTTTSTYGATPTTPAANRALIESILADRSALEFANVTIDVTSAVIVKSVIDGLNESNRAKLLGLPFLKMVDLSLRLAARVSA